MQLQLELPYPQFTSVTADYNPAASSIYNALQVTAQKNYSNGLQFLVTYVWSKSIDDSSAPDDNTSWLGGIISLQDPNKPYLERSLSSFDIPQTFQASYVYALPFGRGRRFMSNSNHLVDGIVRRLGNERRMAYRGRPSARPDYLPTERRCRLMALSGPISPEFQNATTGTIGSTITSPTPRSSCCRPYMRLATHLGPLAPFAPLTTSGSICRS